MSNEIDHVAEKAKGGIGRKDHFILRLNFLEYVGLYGAAQLGDDAGAELALGGGHVHREENRRGAVDGH